MEEPPGKERGKVREQRARCQAHAPARSPHFLINAYGLLFDEITASRRVNVTLGGEIVADPTGLGSNPAG